MPSGMPRFRFWWTAAKIAWREVRAAPGKFLFVVLSVAFGVMAVSGVRGSSDAFRITVKRNVRQWLAADLSARVYEMPSPRQEAVLADLARQGIPSTIVTETVAMATGDSAAGLHMVALKAVDPSVYPFYGALTLEGGRRLRRVLDNTSVVVSSELPERLATHVGGTLRIGGREFRIAGIIAAEPDRFVTLPNPLMRVILTRQGLVRTGLLRFGGRAAHRILFRLPAADQVAAVRARIERAFPEAKILDFRETDPSLQRIIEIASAFLSLVSLIALIVGALGVAMAIYAHLRQRLDSIAVMKSLGARSSQVLRIYGLQAAGLGLVGSIVGIGLGAVGERAAPRLIPAYALVGASFEWRADSLAASLGTGLLVTLLFSLPPLLRIRQVPPALVLRRAMQESAPAALRPSRRPGAALGLAVLLVAAFGALALWTCGSWRMAVWFLAALLAGLAALAAVATLLLAGLRSLVHAARNLSPAWRHGLANLYRPGNHARPVLVALGLGVMFPFTTWLFEAQVVHDLLAASPAASANLFLLNIGTARLAGVSSLVAAQPGVQGPPDSFPLASLILRAVNGLPVEQSGVRRMWYATRADAPPAGVRLISGNWWSPADPAPQASLSEETSRLLNAPVGAWLQFTAAGRPLRVQVVAVHHTSGLAGFRYNLTFNQAALAGVPSIENLAAKVAPGRVAEVERAVYRAFPEVAVLNLADVAAILQSFVDQVAVVMEFLALFPIAAGITILASSVIATRFERTREVAVLKTLGATPHRVTAIFLIEFVVLGAVAGAIGATLGAFFAAFLLRRLFDQPLHFPWIVALGVVAATVLVVNLAGWLTGLRVLRLRPLEILRE
jgi:putative ABC transport system permease protein